MSLSHRSALSLFLVITVLLTGVFLLWLAKADARPAAPAGGQPDSPAFPHPGVYVFFDWSNMDPAQYPYITGGHEVVTWSGIEGRGRGQYDWSWLDGWIASNAALGKPVAIGMNSYDGQCCSPPDGHWLPTWYMRDHPDGYVTCQDGVILPKYWSQAYLDAWGDLVRAAAARYDNDPRVAWVEISHGIYGETSPAENDFNDCLSAAGLTSDLWVQTVNAITDIYHEAWQNKPLLIQYVPFFRERRERLAFSDYAGALGIGMKHNKLLVDHDDQMINRPDYFLYRAGQYDPMFTFAGQVPMGWEAYRLYFPSPSDTMWGFYNAMDKHATYILVTRSLLITTDPLEQKMLHFANDYAGRTLADTPGVWTVLRESRYSWYPQRGNFNFWLYQNDEVPGGRTTPLWEVTSAPEGRYTRRTSESSGNPYMYFNVDNGYLFDASAPVTVTITYLDRGADAWELHYDSHSAHDKVAGRINKTNSNRWKEVSFVLDDARFADGLPGGGDFAGSDFRIWSAGDGDEYIHFVAVKRSPGQSGSLPTPSPTATPRPVATATPAPSASKVLSAHYATQPIVVDGDLGDWPAGDAWLLNRDTADYVHSRSRPDPAETAARLQIAWTSDTLYASAVVTDSEQVADSSEVWLDDGIELGVDGARDRQSGGIDDHQFTIAVDGRLRDLGIHPVAGAAVATRSFPTTYTIELALPIEALGLSSLRPEQILGFTLGLHDDDDGGTWDAYMIYAGTSTLDASTGWGDLVLLPPDRVSIGGVTWYDINGNGLYEPNENDPLSRIEIALLSLQGEVLASAISSDDGHWRINDLLPGQYRVVAETPYGVIATSNTDVLVELPGDDTVNFGFVSATAVSMQRLEAFVDAGSVVLRWQTAHEVANSGFMVYRQAAGSDVIKPLTLTPIPSYASPGGGADYWLRDDNVSFGRLYRYWIETVPGEEQFGPLEIVVPLRNNRHYLFLPAASSR